MQRRRAMELARARMMDAVPTADVVVTNPTHYSVALRYDGRAARARSSSPRARTSRAARSASSPASTASPVVPDPPLARALHASVEVGRMIPEELYQAVAAAARLRLPRRRTGERSGAAA